MPIGFRGGISLRFASWDEIPSAYLQAKISLAHKESSGANLLLCNDYLWDFYIERFRAGNCEQLRHQAVDVLLRSANGGGQLLDTLYCYLKHNCSLAATADAMDIHINTLKYRMNKIRDLIHFDLNNYESRMAFLVSCDIRQAAGAAK